MLKQESLEKVKQMAQKEKKFIFLDFGSPHCKPCLYMKNTIFTIDSVADFVNARFISVDYMEGSEKQRLSELYNVHSEPVFLLLDSEGNLLHRTQGSSTAGEMLQRFRQGLDPENNMAALAKKYDAGKRDPEFIVKYVNTLHIAGLTEKKQLVLANFFPDNFPLDSLENPKYWSLYIKYDESPVSRQTLHVMDNMDKFIKLYGEKPVLSKIEVLYGASARIYIFGKVAPANDPKYPVILKYAQNTNHPNASKWLTYLVPAGYKFSDWPQMAKEIDHALSFNILKGTERDYYRKMMAEQLSWYCDDVNALPYAIKWIDYLLTYIKDDNFRKSITETRQSVVGKIEKLSSKSN
jgi:thiol-disulfide isomerase/thioredoxin